MKPKEISPVLVLSTGRCGSTMISNVLNLHPSILSLSELFAFIGFQVMFRTHLDGKGLWKILSSQWKGLRAMVRQEKRVSEIIYPFGSEGARFSPEKVPAISVAALPHLTSDPDRLLDEIEGAVRDLPRDTLANQLRFLFRWLCDRFGRIVWVERSGGSLMYGPILLRLFPEARVIHVFRDGRDTALSMRRHHAFNMALSALEKLRPLGINTLYTESVDVYAPQKHAFLNRLIWRAFYQLIDMEKLLLQSHDLIAYGEFWSRLMLHGQAYLDPLPANRVLGVRFENVLVRPHEELSRLIRFIDSDLASDAWLDEAVKIPRPTPPRYPRLDPEVLERLTQACAPGLEAFGYDF